MSKFREEAVAGTRFGLIENEDTVTWKARHLFKNRLLRVKVTEMEKMKQFTDEQLQGDFRMMKHEHHFKSCENGTLLIDLFHFESRYGMFGQWFNNLYLTRYLRRLLEERNRLIKEYAESGKWKKLLEL
jgi:ligand-binding SRPBCC domain-containing protein